MSEGKAQKLARMANQIGDYFSALPEKEAAIGAADHLKRYWTPKMIGEIIAFAESGDANLNPTASKAVSALKKQNAG